MMQQKKKQKKNLIFNRTNGKAKNLIVDYDTTLKEALDQYMDTVFGNKNLKIVFILNAHVLDRNDQRKIQDVWDALDIPIKVIE